MSKPFCYSTVKFIIQTCKHTHTHFNADVQQIHNSSQSLRSRSSVKCYHISGSSFSDKHTNSYLPVSAERPNAIRSRNWRALTLECVVTGIMFEWYGSFNNYIVFKMLNCSFIPASHDIRRHHPPHPAVKCSNYAIIFIHSTHKMFFNDNHFGFICTPVPLIRSRLT